MSLDTRIAIALRQNAQGFITDAELLQILYSL